jgi:hypothetical protein
VVFETWRKTVVDVEPEVLETRPEPDPALRNEVDPDPLIEEMVNRLRDSLSSLVAVDEWGRPLAWRNVVRLALGPMASRLRDTQQALELAVSMIPPTAEPVASEELAYEPIEAVAEVLASDGPVAHLSVEDSAAEAPVHDPDAPSQMTVDVILPAAEAVTDQPVGGEAPPEVQPSAVPVVRPSGATSLFTVSGDQRTVAVSPLSARELLSGGSPDDSTATKYDRFLTSLYGERKQVGGDEDRGTGGAGLGDDF